MTVGKYRANRCAYIPDHDWVYAYIHFCNWHLTSHQIIPAVTLNKPNWPLRCFSKPVISIMQMETHLLKIWYHDANFVVSAGCQWPESWHHDDSRVFNDYFWCRWFCECWWLRTINTLRPRQNGRHFADDIFKRIFVNANVKISIKISLKFVPKSPVSNILALVQIMAWRRPGAKPLSEPVMVSLLTHICVIRPQWVKHKCICICADDHFVRELQLTDSQTPSLLV